MSLFDRDTARLLGARTFQGDDCQSQHGGERFTTKGTCVACIAASSRAYRSAHRERQRPRKRERSKAWKARNPEAVAAEKRRYKERNRAIIRQREAARRKAKSDAMAPLREAVRLHREREIARRKAQAKAARQAVIDAKAKERSATAAGRRLGRKIRRNAIERTLRGPRKVAVITLLRTLQSNGCAYCGDRGRLTLDHKTPLARGGQHVLANFQLLCKPHNSSKGARTDDYYRARFGIPRRTPWDVKTGWLTLAILC